MSQQRDPARAQFWREAIAAWRQSGRTVRAFCASRRLSEASLYAWRRELARRERERRPGTRKWSRALPKSSRSAAKFIPLQVLPSALVEVVLPTGVVVRVPTGVEATAVASLIAALRATSC